MDHVLPKALLLTASLLLFASQSSAAVKTYNVTQGSYTAVLTLGDDGKGTLAWKGFAKQDPVQVTISGANVTLARDCRPQSGLASCSQKWVGTVSGNNMSGKWSGTGGGGNWSAALVPTAASSTAAPTTPKAAATPAAAKPTTPAATTPAAATPAAAKPAAPTSAAAACTKPKLISTLSKSVQDLLAQKLTDDITPTSDVNLAIHAIAYHGETAALTALLDACANPNLVDGSGLTPLFMVYGGEDGSGDGKKFEATIKLLLQRGANVNFATKTGFTPLKQLDQTAKLFKKDVKIAASIVVARKILTDGGAK